MANLVKIKGKNHWINAEGNPVEVSRIFPEEKARERVVHKVFKKVSRTSVVLKKAHEEIWNTVDDYLQKLAEEHGETWQGNAQIMSFDQTQKIDVKVTKYIGFNEHFQLAEKKILRFIEEVTEGLNGDVVELIRGAFQRDKKGQIDSKKILGLKRLNIKSKIWAEAMELIDKSIYVKSSKRYINFYIRDQDGKWEVVPLNFSALKVVEVEDEKE